jgi:tripartite-type tricarboxylate transporter receptor subunit TctC
VAPARTPREVVQRLNTEIARIVAEPASRERMIAGDFEPDVGHAGRGYAGVQQERNG